MRDYEFQMHSILKCDFTYGTNPIYLINNNNQTLTPLKKIDIIDQITI